MATAGALETTRTHSGTTVTAREIESLAVNGRNYLDLALLAPGVSRTNTGSSQRFAETSAVPGTGISVSSQRNLNNAFVVDGLSANDDAAGLSGSFYSQEVVREFQVVTSGAPAELGRASAGAFTVVTRSGTNATGGRGYAFWRDDSLDARNPLARREDPLRQGQYRRQRPWPAGQGSRLPVRQRRGLRRIAHRLRDHRARRGGGDQRRPRSLRRRRRPRQHGRLPDDDALRHGVRPRSTPASARPRRPRCATASTTSRAPTPAPPAA